MDEHGPGISTILRALRRRRAVIAVCCLLVPIAAFVLSKGQTKEYTATASLLFRDPGFDQKLFNSQAFEASRDPVREAATNLKLVSLDTVAERTSDKLRIEDIRNKVAVKAEGQSDVVSVAATDQKPRRASLIANTFAEEYIAYRRRADRAKIAEARNLVERRLDELSSAQRQGSQGRSLRNRLEQLNILASLQTGNAELAEAAKPPTSPSSPKVARNTAIGAFLGILLGVALALLFERLDKRLRDPRELEEMYERPILGAIPESKALAGSGAGLTAVGPGEAEAFRMMRANLRYFNVDQDIKSVLVTSAAPGDGKTTVAWNLACAAGVASNVLLIEADLRHPAIAIGFGLRNVAGLSTVLADEAELEDAVQEIPVQESQNGKGVRTLDALLAGPLPPNPSDLLESDRMRGLLRLAEEQYDLVVVDTPPTSVVSDAIPLVTQVGGVIVVGRLAKTTRDAALHLRNQLRNLDAPILGMVVNAVSSESEAYGYAYRYGVDSPQGADDGRARSILKLGSSR